jgi:primosomal replication protein N
MRRLRAAIKNIPVIISGRKVENYTKKLPAGFVLKDSFRQVEAFINSL